MSAFYLMNYVGQTGMGGGAVYIGNGKIVGADVAGGRYHGSYTENGGRLSVNVTLTMMADGMLVTGQPAPRGTKLQLTATWPSNFANGQPQPIQVAGRTVNVTFEKVGDI